MGKKNGFEFKMPWVAIDSVFIYDPQNQQQNLVTEVTQQLDVIPTLLDYLNYSGDWISFGRSAIEKNNEYRFTTMSTIMFIKLLIAIMFWHTMKIKNRRFTYIIL
ncbi:MAG: hypothetical protein R2728_08350 [Chitinophagales bacterium]